MVSFVLCVMSQVEHTKKHNSIETIDSKIDSESMVWRSRPLEYINSERARMIYCKGQLLQTSESKSVKQNADHQNRLTVCFYMLL